MSDLTTSAGDFTFEPTIVTVIGGKEVKTSMMGKECVLPAVEHPHHDALTSLFAVVIKLHKRVEALEAELKSHKDGEK